jgi:hypothetical protein
MLWSERKQIVIQRNVTICCLSRRNISHCHYLLSVSSHHFAVSLFVFFRITTFLIVTICCLSDHNISHCQYLLSLRSQHFSLSLSVVCVITTFLCITICCLSAHIISLYHYLLSVESLQFSLSVFACCPVKTIVIQRNDVTTQTTNSDNEKCCDETDSK